MTSAAMQPLVSCLGLLALSPGLSSCASNPFDSRNAAVPKGLATIPRTIRIAVTCSEERGLYGRPEEWEHDLVSIFRKMKVATAIWESKEPGAEDAEMQVDVTLTRRTRAVPEVDPRGALLDFLAWSTVPLVNWWIRDVNVDPGVSIEVRRRLLKPSGGEPSNVETDIEVQTDTIIAPLLATSLRERRPFWSWSTLWAIFVPSFVFDEPDVAQLDSSSSQRIRILTAMTVAEFVMRGRILAKEVLKDFMMRSERGNWFLTCRAEPGVGELTLRFDGEEQAFQTQIVPLVSNDQPIPVEVRLQPSAAKEPLEGRLLRLGARRREDGQVVGYTIAIPSAEDAGHER